MSMLPMFSEMRVHSFDNSIICHFKNCCTYVISHCIYTHILKVRMMITVNSLFCFRNSRKQSLRCKSIAFAPLYLLIVLFHGSQTPIGPATETSEHLSLREWEREWVAFPSQACYIFQCLILGIEWIETEYYSACRIFCYRSWALSSLRDFTYFKK